MVDTDTLITAAFVALGLALWYASRLVTDNSMVQFGVLVAIGVLVPTVLTERRIKRQRQSDSD